MRETLDLTATLMKEVGQTLEQDKLLSLSS